MIYLLPLSSAALCWGSPAALSGWGGGRGGGGGVILNYWLLSPFPFSFSLILQGDCPSLTALCVHVVSVCLSRYYSPTASLRLHGGKREGSDSGSLEQERPTNSLSCLLCFVSPAFCRCSTALAPLSSRVAPSSPPLSLRLSSDPNALGQHGTDHALIGGVVAVVVFVTLCLIIVLGRYLARHKGKSTAEPHKADESSGACCAFPTRPARSFPRSPNLYNMTTA